MASVKISSPCVNPNFSPAPFSFQSDCSDPRGDSSSYLTLNRENFPPEICKPAPDRLSQHVSAGRRKPHDGEIDIFGAEKYFSGVMDVHAEPAIPAEKVSHQPSKEEEEEECRSKKSRPSRAGSTTSSVTSSNSQSTLLRDHRHRKHRLPNEQRQSNNKRFLGIFPCSCSRKKAVDVGKDEIKSGDGKKIAGFGENGAGRNLARWSREVHSIRDLRMERLGLGLEDESKGMERVGVPEEVFGLLLSQYGGMDSSLRRSLTSVNAVGGGRGDDDLGSDSSSDLFEIKSTSVNSHPFLGQVGAGPTAAMAVEYEPSEASVEWSVVTASAGNFSVASEFTDRSLRADVGRKAAMPLPRRSGLLLGCVNEKAVDVIGGGGGWKAVPPPAPETASSERRVRFWSLTPTPAPMGRYPVDLGLARAGHKTQAFYKH